MLKGFVGIASGLVVNIRIDDGGPAITPPVPPPPPTLAPPPPPGLNLGGLIGNIGSGPTQVIDRRGLQMYLGPILYVVIAILVTSAHLVLIRLWKPTCSVTFVTRLRVFSLWIALWGQCITLLMILAPWEGWLVMLIVTWSLGLSLIHI